MPNSNAVKCPRNHFYDSSKYRTCPYCSDIQDDMPTYALPLSESITAPVSSPSASSFAQDAPTEAMGWNYQSTAPQPDVALPNTQQDDGKTVSLGAITTAGNVQQQPTVGWLICIKGNSKGRSFPIRSNRNFIGRAADMDISIQDDNAISRQKHAIITYVPKNRIFIAQPGESRELFYVNDNVVLDNLILTAYDKIEIGQSLFLFVPLCGDKFNWEDFMR